VYQEALCWRVDPLMLQGWFQDKGVRDLGRTRELGQALIPWRFEHLRIETAALMDTGIYTAHTGYPTKDMPKAAPKGRAFVFGQAKWFNRLEHKAIFSELETEHSRLSSSSAHPAPRQPAVPPQA
jgi:hypothetical protein